MKLSFDIDFNFNKALTKTDFRNATDFISKIFDKIKSDKGREFHLSDDIFRIEGKGFSLMLRKKNYLHIDGYLDGGEDSFKKINQILNELMAKLREQKRTTAKSIELFMSLERNVNKDVPKRFVNSEEIKAMGQSLKLDLKSSSVALEIHKEQKGDTDLIAFYHGTLRKNAILFLGSDEIKADEQDILERFYKRRMEQLTNIAKYLGVELSG